MAGRAQLAPSAQMANGGSSAAQTRSGDRPAVETTPVSVKRKKQKRRQKQAARLAAEQLGRNGYGSADSEHHHESNPPYDFETDERQDLDDVDADDLASGAEYHDDYVDAAGHHHHHHHHHHAGHSSSAMDGVGGHFHHLAGRRTKKKKGTKSRSDSQPMADDSPASMSTPSLSMPQQRSLPSHAAHRPTQRLSKNRSIWNTSTQEERENIKVFWLELGEEERRQLVKVEKDAVLKKMKEQQKHSCSCTVCGRKRTAIEEELEVLYDAYYEELEQYANHSQGSFDKDSPIVPPPRLYRPPFRPPGHPLQAHGHFHPSQGRVQELPENDEDLDEDYDEDEEDDEPYSDDDLDDDATRTVRADFFAFGNSLTVKDGILTVADDLLKNDGKHFIDMMEQLAERRMQREEDTQFAMAAAHQAMHGGHNHGPLDEDDYDEEEDEDYDSQEDDEDYEEDEMDAMTEEQRMEEGRRMFQIFAARMFEQRVLTAYREKVAEQRQQKLIEELMEEQSREEQRSAKKAREAQKKKDKKKLQKQAKEEEKARREAEKAAEEAAARAAQEKRLEEQRRKREELRKKKEAEKKAQEEERVRKEAEKQRRLKEERDRQAEAERKLREQKEHEKKRRDEAKRKEREEREAREKEIREKKAQEERERKVREEQTKRERMEQAARDERERRELESAQQTPSAPKRSSQCAPMPIPSGLQRPQGPPASVPSPHFQAATPVVPNAPTPVRARQSSQQGSYSSSPHSQPASAEQSQTSVSPRSMPMSHSSGPSSTVSMKSYNQPPMLHHPQPSAPVSPLGAAGRSHHAGFPTLNGLPSNPPGLPPMMPRQPLGHDLPLYPSQTGPIANQFRGFPAPNGIPLPPGINGVRPPTQPGRGFPLEGLGFHGQQPLPGVFPTPQAGLPSTHARQPSGSFDKSPLQTQPQSFAISRPSPIKRPSSTTRDDRQRENERTTQRDVDNLSAHLGSSALLDDADIPNLSTLSQSLPGGVTTPGAFQVPGRASFAAPSLLADPLAASKNSAFPIASGIGSTWGAQTAFGTSNMPGASTWGVGAGTGTGWSNNAFGTTGHHRIHASRPVATRLLVIQACKQLTNLSPAKSADAYHDVNLILRQVEQLRLSDEAPISMKEVLDICDTEGNPQNGGGSFSIKEDANKNKFVKFEPDSNSTLPGGPRTSIAPGDIGSPVPGNSMPTFGGIGSAPSVLRQQFPSAPTGF